MRIALLVLLTLVACGPKEGDAREYLKSQGITATELTKDGKSFTFVGTKDKQICKGSVTIDGGSTSFTSQCERDPGACKPGAPDECMKIADELFDADPAFPRDAMLAYRVACGDKVARACGRAGLFDVLHSVFDKAREFSKKGCDLGDADACVRLGGLELEGKGGPKDEAKALELFKQGCAKSDLKGCRNVAGLLVDKEPTDLEGALAAGEVACKGKYEDSCFVLGVVLYKQRKDTSRAIELFEPTCKDTVSPKRGLACNLAGVILADGVGMRKDPGRALPFFEQACAADHGEACHNVGRAYKNGSGTAKDPAKAKVALEKSCKLGVKDAC